MEMTQDEEPDVVLTVDEVSFQFCISRAQTQLRHLYVFDLLCKLYPMSAFPSCNTVFPIAVSR